MEERQEQNVLKSNSTINVDAFTVGKIGAMLQRKLVWSTRQSEIILTDDLVQICA